MKSEDQRARSFSAIPIHNPKTREVLGVLTFDGEPDPLGHVVVVWDPTVISEEEYAGLILALGDLVRAEGGLGVERLHSEGRRVRVKDTVPV